MSKCKTREKEEVDHNSLPDLVVVGVGVGVEVVGVVRPLSSPSLIQAEPRSFSEASPHSPVRTVEDC